MINDFKRLFPVFLFFLLAIPAVPARAMGPSAQHGGKEEVLRHAQALIEKGRADRSNIVQAIELLTRNEGRFPEDPRFPLYLAQANYKMADPSADINAQFPIYETAGTYADKALKLDPGRTEAHYWHGLYMLKKAQKNGGIRAYFFARSGVKELETVRSFIPAYDHAGASRVLALLYCVAPGWSPFGDIDKSIRLGEEAVRIAPDYPLNHLYLADAYNKRGVRESAIREYKKVIEAPASFKAEREKAHQMLAKLGVVTLH